MLFAALRKCHPMIGCDWHIPTVPPGVVLPAPTPYGVVNIMGNLLGIELTTLYTPTVYGGGMQAKMCKGSDIGSMIPHIGTLSLTIIIEILFSGSKCHFGPSNIFVKDQHGADQNPAAAVLVYANVNLNCGFPVPTPLDVVIAPNTAVLPMTWGDILGGLFSMIAGAIAVHR